MAKRILIIDDEKDMQVYLRTLFQKAGYEPFVASDGEEGVRKAEELLPDLITMDILMPKKSGAIAYETLRDSAITKDIPVIILTGLSEREQLFGEGSTIPRPDAIVDKPIDRDAFLATVKGIIGD